MRRCRRGCTAAMPEGIVIHSCYPAQRPVKELSRVNYIINMEYEEGRPLEAETATEPPAGAGEPGGAEEVEEGQDRASPRWT